MLTTELLKHMSDAKSVDEYLGFSIQEISGWYLATPKNWRGPVLEAATMPEMRRKIWRFFRNINGQDSPLAMRCVLVLNGSGGLMLRMDTHLFAMVDDASTAAQVMAAVRSIYNATF